MVRKINSCVFISGNGSNLKNLIKYSKKKYAQDQEYAKTNKLGLWSMTFELPWSWRKKNN